MYKVLKNQNKAGSFTNVATIRKDGNDIFYVEENVNDITVRRENQYKGWLCWSGIESLMIDADGNVFTATCRTKKLGNIYTEFTLPNEPIICTKNWCACAADLNTSKAIDLESAKLLRRVDNAYSKTLGS